MKKILIILFFILSVFLSLYSIQVNPGAGPYYVGDQIQFRATNSACYDIYPGTLYFGDGSNITGVTSFNWVSHRYRNPGTYSLMLSSGMCTTENRTIVIEEDRYIEVSTQNPVIGQEITFTAVNFHTPNNIRWDMGDGTILRTRRRKSGVTGGSVVTHTYTTPGNYTVRAYDWFGNSSYIPVSITVNIVQPVRAISHLPDIPRADQRVIFDALNFSTSTIVWNFGDGTPIETAGINITHRFQTQGTYTVRARDSGVTHSPVTKVVTVLPDIRRIEVSSPEIKKDATVTVTSFDFYGDYVLWNFGDGTTEVGLHEINHTYTRSGTFTISAYDDSGESTVPIQTAIKVVGIDDQVFLEVAEISFDNGKYYKIVAKNSKNNLTVLTMKMRGTGNVSGRWLVDNHPYEYFNEVVYQGELKKIYTRQVPGLPTIEPGLHTVTLELTRPSDIQVTFPVLKYYVLPYEVFVETVSPPYGFVAKEKEIPEFSWKEPRGGVKYQISFSNYLHPFLYNTKDLKWIDLKTQLKYTPDVGVWNHIKRNRWTYWRVRSLDTLGNVVAESDVMDIKVIVGTAEVTINRVTDLSGKEIKVTNNRINTSAVDLLVQGSIKYEGDSKYLLLRVYADDELVDQLLFRDLKKNDMRRFETSIPNKKKNTKVLFQVLKTSSPAVIVGIKGITLKK